MPVRKKTSTIKKKTPARKTQKTKATKSRKTKTKISAPKKPQKTKKEISAIIDPISFGLLQHEIDELLDAHHKALSDKNLEINITKELAKLLPKTEKVTEVKDSKNHTDIVVRSATARDHSPFVLDLSDLIEKKKRAEEKKHLVRNFFQQKANGEIKEEEIIPIEKPTIAIIEEKEEVVTVVTPKKERKESIEDQFTSAPWYYNFNLPINWHRTIIVYLMICLMIVAPIKVFSYYSELQETKSEVMNYAQNAYEDLKLANRAVLNEEFGSAQENFTSAGTNFTQAADKIASINTEVQALLKIIPMNGANLADAEYLLQIGETVAVLGNDLVNLTSEFKTKDSATITERISFVQQNLSVLLPKLQNVQINLNKIRIEAIPEDKQESFLKIKNYFNIVYSDLEELNRFSTTMNIILGENSLQRYLFVFQNNNEIRPTGGFMGSLALVDIDQGEITNMEIPGGGIYYLQGQLLENKIAPYPIQLINSRWEMQDANWFPDFPTSAEKIRWFYEHSGGPTVDGVLAFNVSIVPKLLEVLGPIEMPEYGKILTPENFVDELQWAVEYEYDHEENNPKQIISDMAPKLIEKIFSAQGDKLIEVLQILKTSLNEKDVQMYFRNEAVQNKISSYGWTGEIKQSSRDYLAIIDTNIGGYKTDAYIDQNYEIASEIQKNGEIINTLKITRTHNGSDNIFGNKSNVDFVRVYVPQGSQLLSATGFSNITSTNFDAIDKTWEEDEDLLKIQGALWIDPVSKTQVNNEFGKTVFGNWIQTDVGETSEVVIKYKLPFKLELKNSNNGLFNVFNKKQASTFHSLFLQKQSGKQNTTYQVSIKLPDNKKLNWSYPENLDIDNDRINLATSLNEDALISFVLE